MTGPYSIGHEFDQPTSLKLNKCKHCETQLVETDITILSFTEGSYAECHGCHARSPIFTSKTFPADQQEMIDGAIQSWNDWNKL